MAKSIVLQHVREKLKFFDHYIPDIEHTMHNEELPRRKANRPKSSFVFVVTMCHNI
jgi:hypothetical protein